MWLQEGGHALGGCDSHEDMASGVGAVSFVYVAVTFMILKGLILRAINVRTLGLAIVWVIPVMMFDRFPQGITIALTRALIILMMG